MKQIWSIDRLLQNANILKTEARAALYSESTKPENFFDKKKFKKMQKQQKEHMLIKAVE